jgi:outer membrane protein OmpA-like peptidoglycan-associated protein
MASRSSGAAPTLLVEAEVRASNLARHAQEAQEVAEKDALEASCLRDHARKLTAELATCHARTSQAQESAVSAQASAMAALDKAVGEVKGLSKQKLEEVRSLTSPTPILQRAVGLVYCLLHPDKALKYKTLENIPWKQILAPMLKGDDLIHSLTNFTSMLSHETHPLVAYPAVLELIAHNVCEEPAATDTPRSERGSSSPKRKSSKSIASKHAAQLLRAHSKLSLASTASTCSTDSLVPPSGSVGGIVQCRSPSFGSGPELFQRSGSKRSSVATALLGTDGRLTVDAVEFSSTAVASLFRWVLSQLQYARKLQEFGSTDFACQVNAAKEKTEQLERAEAEAHVAAENAEVQATCAEDNAKRSRVRANSLTLEAGEASAEVETLKQKQVAEEAEMAAMLAAEAARQQRAERAERRRVAEEAAEMRRSQETSSSPQARGMYIPLSSPQERGVAPEEQEPKLEAVLEHGQVAVSEFEVEVRERITFAQNSTQMSSFATRAVQGVMKIMNDNSDLKICVEGHGGPDESASISTKRANAVLDLLVKQGVPRHRLRVAGFGSSFPYEGDGSSARVEFSVIQEISIKGTVQFSPCSSDLTFASRPLLEKIVALLVARPCLRVRVEGHTCNAPNWGCSNQELSQERAHNIVRYMVDHGVESERLAPVGFGEHLPCVPNSSHSSKAQNRRVEFHVLQRETVQGLKDLDREKVQVDVHGLQQLERTATGASVSLSRPIRVAAADLLVRLGAEWPVQRLLYIAARKENPQKCMLALLPEDCSVRIMRFYFFLGCSSLAESR